MASLQGYRHENSYIKVDWENVVEHNKTTLKYYNFREVAQLSVEIDPRIYKVHKIKPQLAIMKC